MSSSLENIERMMADDIINRAPEKLRDCLINALNSKTLALDILGLTDGDVVDYILPYLNYAKDVLKLFIYDDRDEELTEDKILMANKALIALAKNSTITCVVFISYPISDEVAIEFSKSQILTSLSLTASKLSRAGGAALAESKSLTFLELSMEPNVLDSRDVLAESLTYQQECEDAVLIEVAKSQTLKELRIAWFEIGHRSADALAKNTLLKCLQISFCNIKDEVAVALSSSQSLVNLNLTRIRTISKRGSSAILKCPALKTLDFTIYERGELDPDSIARNQTLTTLATQLKLIDSEAMLTALAGNKAITELNLYDDMSEEAKEALTSVFQKQKENYNKEMQAFLEAKRTFCMADIDSFPAVKTSVHVSPDGQEAAVKITPTSAQLPVRPPANLLFSQDGGNEIKSLIFSYLKPSKPVLETVNFHQMNGNLKSLRASP